MKKSKVKAYSLGSMRRMPGKQKLFLLAQHKGGEMHLYERYQVAGGDWHWADHGYLGDENLEALGIAVSDANGGDYLFAMTDSGNLWQRHWNYGINDWAWVNYGKP